MSFRDAFKLPSSQITDEAVYRDRRRLLQVVALTPALGVAGVPRPIRRLRPRPW